MIKIDVYSYINPGFGRFQSIVHCLGFCNTYRPSSRKSFSCSLP